MSHVFDPERIEREFAVLQRQLSPSDTRASLYNLVIVHRPAADARVDGALSYLLGKRPARIVRIRLIGDGESSIHVSARCFPDNENRGVCFQEIIIENGSDGVGAAVGSWTPLLSREIPTYLWWLDSLVPAPELLYRSLEFTDKVLIDSFLSEASGEPACRVFSGFVRDALGNEIPVADLAWRKLSTLRQATAHLFDPENVRPCMNEIEHVSITGGTRVTAFLYISWLADRLRWTVPEKDKDSGPYADAEGRPVTWDHGKEGPLENGIFIRFRLQSCDELSIRADGEGFVRLSTPGSAPGRKPFRIPEEGKLLMEELDYPYHDYLFAEMVRNTGCLMPSPD